jgi:hypothetical protein
MRFQRTGGSKHRQAARDVPLSEERRYQLPGLFETVAGSGANLGITVACIGVVIESRLK